VSTELRTELRDSLAAAMRKVPIDAPPDDYAAAAVPVVAAWLRTENARLGEERRRDRNRPDGGDQQFRIDTAMQMLAIKHLADALTDTQETDR
jgi:hypothetical protein